MARCSHFGWTIHVSNVLALRMLQKRYRTGSQRGSFLRRLKCRSRQTWFASGFRMPRASSAYRLESWLFVRGAHLHGRRKRYTRKCYSVQAHHGHIVGNPEAIQKRGSGRSERELFLQAELWGVGDELISSPNGYSRE